MQTKADEQDHTFPFLKNNMSDPTEPIRRKRLAEINGDDTTRESLVSRYGQVWSTEELSRDFDVEGFLAPYVVVRRKRDEKRGSLEFRHDPRFYFNFVADEK